MTAGLANAIRMKSADRYHIRIYQIKTIVISKSYHIPAAACLRHDRSRRSDTGCAGAAAVFPGAAV